MSSKKNFSFEDAMTDLEKIVRELENGDLTLEESVKKYQKGVELSKFCNKKLDDIEKKITVILENDNGGIEEIEFTTDVVVGE